MPTWAVELIWIDDWLHKGWEVPQEVGMIASKIRSGDVGAARREEPQQKRKDSGTPEERPQAPSEPPRIPCLEGPHYLRKLAHRLHSRRSICNDEGRGAAAMAMSLCRLVCEGRDGQKSAVRRRACDSRVQP
eukprot:4336774-Pleurochrysis_carterae.AAC.4